MLLHIPQILTAAQLVAFRHDLKSAQWIDGRATAGHLSSLVKRNHQLPEDHPVGRKLGNTILDALERNSTFVSAALPAKVVPPLFNQHSGTEAYGRHVDGSVRPVPGSSMRVRTDLSATLFLSEPGDYDGGELSIEDGLTSRRIKLPAGDLLLYPSSSIHQVEPVTRGIRWASFFWIQSMVREASRREMLFRLDLDIRELTRDVPEHPSILSLTSIYHNLVREWSDV